MGIDVEREQLLTWSEARLLFLLKPTIRTLRRWATTGAKGVVLESTPIGGGRGTSKEAITRFLKALQEREDD